MDWGRFDSPLLDKNLPNTFWVQESGDDPQNFERNFPKSERFHITLSPDSDTTEEYKKRDRDIPIGGHILLIQELSSQYHKNQNIYRNE